jgi:quinoprotein glucose dehydrogenase
MYRHDYAGTGYSPLTDIHARNVSTLHEVWSYRLPADANSQATPIVLNGAMYLPAGDRVVALDCAVAPRGRVLGR